MFMTYVDLINNLSDLDRTYYEYHGELSEGTSLDDLVSIEGRLIA